MWVKIKIKNNLEGKEIFLNGRLNWKEKKILTKGKNIKRMKTNLEKTIHHKLGYNDKIENIKTFTNEPRKKK